MYNDELTHWGIKGQKWGVRRWQNEDGTLTEAGKDRYGDIEVDKSSSMRQLRKNVAKSDRKVRDEYVRRRESADDETRKALEKDRKYKKLTKDYSEKNEKYRSSVNNANKMFDAFDVPEEKRASVLNNDYYESMRKERNESRNARNNYSRQKYNEGRKAVDESFSAIQHKQIDRACKRSAVKMTAAALAGVSLFVVAASASNKKHSRSNSRSQFPYTRY